MEATPDDYHIEDITERLEKIPGVGLVHDVHLWSLSSGKHAFICHIELTKDYINAGQEVLIKVDKIMQRKFKLNHLTI